MVFGIKKSSLHDRVVAVTENYLGPAANRFIDRQIQTHIGKDPNELTKKDLKKLIDWIRLAMTLLSDDEKMVNEFTSSLKTLTKEPAKNER